MSATVSFGITNSADSEFQKSAYFPMLLCACYLSAVPDSTRRIFARRTSSLEMGVTGEEKPHDDNTRVASSG